MQQVTRSYQSTKVIKICTYQKCHVLFFWSCEVLGKVILFESDVIDGQNGKKIEKVPDSVHTCVIKLRLPLTS